MEFCSSNRRKRIQHKFNASFLLSFIFLAVFFVSSYAAPLNVFTRRYFRKAVNPTSKSSRDIAFGIMARAAKAGYNGMLYDDSKIPIAHSLNASWGNGVKEIIAEGKKLGLTVMPMSLGQLTPTRNGLEHGEAIPVKGQIYRVSGGQAIPLNEPAITIPNGGFEDQASVGKKTWRTKVVPGKDFVVDTQNKHSGNASVCFINPTVRNVFAYQTGVKVKPFTAYRVSVWIKTENLETPRDAGIYVYGAGRWLLHIRDAMGVQKNQNWTEHSFYFNSLYATSVTIYINATKIYTTTGKLWFDNVSIRESSFWRVQQRSTTPVVVRPFGKTSTPYKERKDYTVQSDLTKKTEGKLLIPAGSAIKNGDKLSVDWYQLAAFETNTAVASYCHEEAWDIVRTNSKALNDAFGSPRGWHLKYSEWRNAFWDPACIASFDSAGNYMGWVQQKSVGILRELNPRVETYVWNDAFDAYHNAKPGGIYYMINGNASGSWATMDPRTVIINWRGGDAKRSLFFLAGKDPKMPIQPHTQMIYSLQGGIEQWLKALNELEQQYGEGVKDYVIGVHYDTWQAQFWDNLEPMAAECQAEGRWMTNTDPFQPFKYHGPEKAWKGPDVISIKEPKQSAMRGVRLRVAGGQIHYSVERPGKVQIRLTDLSGRLAKVILDETKTTGQHSVSFDSSKLASGIYLVSIRSTNGKGMQTRKIVLM